MLQQIYIENIALVDKVTIEPGPGLNILTGETGAGKSIIIDSLQAVLGERLSKDIIRTGAEKALVEAVFCVKSQKLDAFLEEIGIQAEEDGTLIISRDLNISGRTNCRVNGKLVTLSALKEIGQMIVDVHGQHDNQSLLRTGSHIDLLDAFGGKIIESQKNEFNKLLEQYKKTKGQLEALSGLEGEKERRADLLKFQIDEISKAEIKEGEDEELSRKRAVIVNSEKIGASLAKAYESLFAGGSSKAAIDLLNEAVSEVATISRIDPKYDDISNRLRDLTYLLEDLAIQLREERDSIDYDPLRLEHIEERLDLLFKLKKKYGGSIVKVLEYLETARLELEGIEHSDETIKKLTIEIDRMEQNLFESAEILHKARLEAAEKLEALIGGALEDLEMKQCRFAVCMEYDNEKGPGHRKYNSNGLDKVEFMFSPNIGEPLKPLSKIASGGEMSRIMLAIKTILAEVDSIPTLIFDEIDIGISGRAAQKVAEKLAYISKGHQVLCVTHLPQIASMADTHFLIQKEVNCERTHTNVKLLKSPENIEEIARMLGGTGITEATRKLAAELLDDAAKIKKQ